jgi:hypothetical protein
MYHDGQGKFYRKSQPKLHKMSVVRIDGISLTIHRWAWYYSSAKKPAAKRLDLFHRQ